MTSERLPFSQVQAADRLAGVCQRLPGEIVAELRALAVAYELAGYSRPAAISLTLRDLIRPQRNKGKAGNAR